MNSFIEHLNQLGGRLSAFAWPMLWQSSLLIALVLAVDFSLAGKLRASVRHALWLVVLVKLLLPPTLALPTGAAWWLFPSEPPVKAPVHQNYVVTYDNALPMPAFTQETIPFAQPPPPKLDRAGWALLATGMMSAGLLSWLLFRWVQVVRMVRRAVPSAELGGPIRDVCRLAGLHWPAHLRIVDDQMSPAVCGLFRTVILLPRMLAEKLSAEQLRAVLLHEAIHIRRGDIWVNCAQALLQAAYWWHPLVWLANARIRRLREEAVDDAVMLALGADAEIYAPTLLEVARLAFRRPLLSLGLVGIMESRSALRQRIERLLVFRAPHRAGLTLGSLCGIFVFSAVALPMGEGPAPVEKEMAADAGPPLRGMTAPAVVVHTNRPSVLVEAEIYDMPTDDLEKLVCDLRCNGGQAGGDAWWSASPEEFSKLQRDLKKSRQIPWQRSRIQTSSNGAAQFLVGNDPYEPELDCLLVVDGTQVDLTAEEEIKDWAADAALTNRFKFNASLPNPSGLVIRMQNGVSDEVVCLSVGILTNTLAASFQPRLGPATLPPSAEAALSAPVHTGPGRQAIMAKLGNIRLENVSYDGLPLNEVLKQLSAQCKLLDPEHKGINFLIKNNPDRSGLPAAGSAVVGVPGMAAGHGAVSAPNIDPDTGIPMTPTAGVRVAGSEAVDVGSCIIKIPSLTDVRLADVLDAVVLVADHPIKYSIQDFAIVFSARSPETSPLSARTFRVDPNTFDSGLESVGATSFGGIQNNGSTGGGGAGGGQNQNQGAMVGVVNAFPGASEVPNAGQDAGGGGRLDQAAPAAEPEGQKAMTFRLNHPKPEAELKTLLSEAGVKIPPARLIYNANAGLFVVRGAPDQLALVNRLVLKLDGYSPQEIQSTDTGFVKRLNAIPTARDESTNLFTRTFQVNPITFYSSLEMVSTQDLGGDQPGRSNGLRGLGDSPDGGYVTPQNSSSSLSALAAAFFTKLGVDFKYPRGKAIFYKDRIGYLFVKATESDLDTIEQALQVLNQPLPQVHIKARFYEVPKGTLDDSDFGKFLNLAYPNGQPMGILPSKDADAARQTLESRKGFENLGGPEVTTTSGRRTQMRATEMITVLTNLAWGENQNSPVLQSNTVELGPVLDIVPHVLADGYTLMLTANPSVTEFLGYDAPTNDLERISKPGDELPGISPRFQNQHFNATVNLWDGQTLILRLNSGKQVRSAGPGQTVEAVSQKFLPDYAMADLEKHIKEDREKTREKEVVVFITATIVDFTDKRVHSDDEMPFAQTGTPTQPWLPRLPPKNNNNIRSSVGIPSSVGDFPPYHNGDPNPP